MAIFAAYCLIALRLDADGGLPLQMGIGACTWAFVLVAARGATGLERLQLFTMIAVATAFECLGSVIWGLYRYRLDNLPMYVPPGHGLFYLAALRAARLPALRAHSRAAVATVLAASGLAALYGAAFSPTPDYLGLLCWFLFAWFVLRTSDPLFFAVSFAFTMALEYYGTVLGTWRWGESVPYVGLSAGNPPSAVGAGYCIIDAATRFCLPHVARAITWGRLLAGFRKHPSY